MLHEVLGQEVHSRSSTSEEDIEEINLWELGIKSLHRVKKSEKGVLLTPMSSAIHLEQVIAGTAPEDYHKPDKFFARTCRDRSSKAFRRNREYRTINDSYYAVRRWQDSHACLTMPSCIQRGAAPMKGTGS